MQNRSVPQNNLPESFSQAIIEHSSTESIREGLQGLMHAYHRKEKYNRKAAEAFLPSRLHLAIELFLDLPLENASPAMKGILEKLGLILLETCFPNAFDINHRQIANDNINKLNNLSNKSVLENETKQTRDKLRQLVNILPNLYIEFEDTFANFLERLVEMNLHLYIANMRCASANYQELLKASQKMLESEGVSEKQLGKLQRERALDACILDLTTAKKRRLENYQEDNCAIVLKLDQRIRQFSTTLRAAFKHANPQSQQDLIEVAALTGLVVSGQATTSDYSLYNQKISHYAAIPRSRSLASTMLSIAGLTLILAAVAAVSCATVGLLPAIAAPLLIYGGCLASVTGFGLALGGTCSFFHKSASQHMGDAMASLADITSSNWHSRRQSNLSPNG